MKREDLEDILKGLGANFVKAVFPYRVWDWNGDLIYVPSKEGELKANDLAIVQARLDALKDKALKKNPA